MKGGAAAAVDDLAEVKDATSEDLWPGPTNPMGVARKLAKRDRRHDETWTLRYWRGGWWTWRGSHWAEVPASAVKSSLYHALDSVQYAHTKADGTEVVMPWRPNRSRVADVTEALGAVVHLGDQVEMPSWLDAADERPSGPIIACANGLLELRRNPEGALIPTLRPLDPAYFNSVGAALDYDHRAPTPARWLRFLDEVFDGDPEAITALQQWFGYVLSGRVDLQKILLLIGPKRSGKGTIERVLSALIGEGNVVGMPLSDLGQNFGLQKLIGKPLAVVSDARLGARSDATRLIERLLSISGEGTISVPRKMRDDWVGKLPTRFMVLTNEVPQLPDASGAMASRFVVVGTKRSFLGREDTSLTSTLLGELPGILNWSLDGLRSLTTTGAFAEPASSADARETLNTLGATVEAYLADRCQDTGEIATQALYDDHRWWCMRAGEEPRTKAVFCRDVLAARPGIARKRAREGDVRTSVYVGLSLKPAPYSTNGYPGAGWAAPPHYGPAAGPTDERQHERN